MPALVYIYRNLHKACWSVKYNGIVVAHTPCAFIWDAELKVNPGGRNRALRERQKNVHAYAICALDDLFLPPEATTFGDFESDFKFDCVKSLGETLDIRITYHYDRHSSFVESNTGDPVHRAGHVYFNTRGGMYIQKFFEPPPNRPVRDRDWHGVPYAS